MKCIRGYDMSWQGNQSHAAMLQCTRSLHYGPPNRLPKDDVQHIFDWISEEVDLFNNEFGK
jgi:predicted RNase H-like nuclease